MNVELLTRDNPDLLNLEAAYRSLPFWDILMKGSAWETFQLGINPKLFRGECMYLAQLALGTTAEQFANTFNYARGLDEGLLGALDEDDAFGCVTFERDSIIYSRDLLDSILELHFLRKCGFSVSAPLNVLDIGAGYGRFAYRMTSAWLNTSAICVDAVPISSFLCDFYLDYRLMPEVAYSVSLTQMGEPFMHNFDLAVNIHSFSEMTLSAINFWLDYVRDLNIPYLFIVPHDNRWVSVNGDGTYPSFKPALAAHGYTLEVEQPKYPAGVDGVYPTVYTLWRHS